MKKLFILLFCTLFTLTSCLKSDYEKYIENPVSQEQIDNNVKAIFGVSFPKDQDWNTSLSGEVKIDINNKNICKVQVLAYISDESTEDENIPYVTILNEMSIDGESQVTLNYDAPKDNLGIYVAFITNDGQYIFKKVENNKASLTRSANTRALDNSISLPIGEFSISTIEPSYANTRGWVPGEMLYQLSDYNSQKISRDDYDDEYKLTFRMLIFSYFKNGRKYNNLPLVQESGYYNENIYPITTGDDPIIISPVYKNDGGYKEVVNSDLYYYYFKESDITGDPVAYFESLPKYKAIQFDQCIKGDDVIEKHVSYALMYFGDGNPEVGTKGSYQFPKGYKIGFMVRAKTTAESLKKQGELYGDGRLNNHINNYGNFKSSKLGEDGPRMTWLTVNDRMLLCCESGTDTDFNDIILEVEGGIEGIINPPVVDYNYYTFCYEDTPLGDYDLNDVVIKGRRVDNTHVEYTVMACGAFDDLYIHNINGNVINKNVEVHRLLGVNDNVYINTERNGLKANHVKETIIVPNTFSFLDDTTQPYIYDKTNNVTVKIAKNGQDPHAIMIPYDFRWPLEKVCIKNAYLSFNDWGVGRITSTTWYQRPNETVVY